MSVSWRYIEWQMSGGGGSQRLRIRKKDITVYFVRHAHVRTRFRNPIKWSNRWGAFSKTTWLKGFNFRTLKAWDYSPWTSQEVHAHARCARRSSDPDQRGLRGCREIRCLPRCTPSRNQSKEPSPPEAWNNTTRDLLSSRNAAYVFL